VLSISISPQVQNSTLLGTLNQYPSIGYNDCWGYVDSQGREYALLGTQHGTSIINVTNPATPVQVAFIPGPPSLWREIKTHSHYMYVVTEGTTTGKGLQIVDLSQLPTTATLVNTVTTWFQRAHNLYIHDGFCYIVGTDNGGGMHVLDLTDPVNPVRTAYYTTSGYIHDVYVWNDTAYASSEDTYDMVFLGNKSLPVRVNQSAALPGIYAHSGWLTSDKRYFIACEEFNQRDITVWDLQSRSWNLVVPNWQMPTSSYVHNVFVRGIYAYVSYYTEGLVVLDLTNPSSPVKVGQYDTYPGGGLIYDGAWGCYPFLPSGNVVVSDMSTGLYMVDFLLDPVPVELTSFTASALNNAVEVKWSTATEQNNRGFEVQRSADMSNWRTLSFIEGKGTTAEVSDYSYIDSNPFKGKNYYRLIQYDFDGTFKEYDAIEANVSLVADFTIDQNYPNPFNPSTTIKFGIPSESHVNLEIFNSLGERVSTLVNEVKPAGSYTIDFNASGLTSGVYIAKIAASGQSKFIKMNLIK
jgi:choice-of-anchor B domain-containing protein